MTDRTLGRKLRTEDESPSAYFARGLPRGPLVQQIQFLHEVFMYVDRPGNLDARAVFEEGLKRIAAFTAAQGQHLYHPDKIPPALEFRR